jgi:hypothetical protein
VLVTAGTRCGQAILDRSSRSSCARRSQSGNPCRRQRLGHLPAADPRSAKPAGSPSDSGAEAGAVRRQVMVPGWTWRSVRRPASSSRVRLWLKAYPRGVLNSRLGSRPASTGSTMCGCAGPDIGTAPNDSAHQKVGLADPPSLRRTIPFRQAPKSGTSSVCRPSADRPGRSSSCKVLPGPVSRLAVRLLVLHPPAWVYRGGCLLSWALVCGAERPVLGCFDSGGGVSALAEVDSAFFAAPGPLLLPEVAGAAHGLGSAPP